MPALGMTDVRAEREPPSGGSFSFQVAIRLFGAPVYSDGNSPFDISVGATCRLRRNPAFQKEKVPPPGGISRL